MRPNENKHWSKSDVGRLKFMAEKGFATASIAGNLGRTKDAVYTKASKENVSLLPRDK